MKLILQKDVKNLGKAGDQVSVKAGFARNFLIPKGYALLLNKNRLKTWEHQKVIISAKKRKAVSERKLLIDKLSAIKLLFERESQKDDKIFGSVTAHEISQALEEKHNISVDKRDIHFSELKTVGNHKVNIQLDSKLKADILLTIKGKMRKKKETAPVQKAFAQKESLSPKSETTAESKEQTSLSQAEPAPSEKESKKNETSKQSAQKSDSFFEKKLEDAGNSQKEFEAKSQLKDKEFKTKEAQSDEQKLLKPEKQSVEVQTDQKQTLNEKKQVIKAEGQQDLREKPTAKAKKQPLNKRKPEKDEEVKTEKRILKPSGQLEESLTAPKAETLKTPEELKVKKESEDKSPKSSSQDKAKQKETKKSGGFLKRLFGKKK